MPGRRIALPAAARGTPVGAGPRSHGVCPRSRQRHVCRQRLLCVARRSPDGPDAARHGYPRHGRDTFARRRALVQPVRPNGPSVWGVALLLGPGIRKRAGGGSKTSRAGFSDMRLRLSVLVRGAPAASVARDREGPGPDHPGDQLDHRRANRPGLPGRPDQPRHQPLGAQAGIRPVAADGPAMAA